MPPTKRVFLLKADMVMIDALFAEKNKALLAQLKKRQLAALDLIPHRDVREKLVELVLTEPPRSGEGAVILLEELRRELINTAVDDLSVVVFGGGTGLSNIIGGDSRQKGWTKHPFDGLKQIFPKTRAVVCVTDDGGSTGELLKDLPILAIGDIRHVMLSSIQQELLQARYSLTAEEALNLTGQISRLFNHRFDDKPESLDHLLAGCDFTVSAVPDQLRSYLENTLSLCFSNESFNKTLARPHCLGNLVIGAALCRSVPELSGDDDAPSFSQDMVDEMCRALSECAQLIGAPENAVLPCTGIPAQLRFGYTDGVEVTGEEKSSQAARGFAIDQVVSDFCATPYVANQVKEQIRRADILIMAPGSLFSSIIPVLQVPGIAAAVRENTKALKLLIANLWVQEGETDRSVDDPDRKFHVSDMIEAYDKNLPGGIQGLCNQILCMSLQDVPASVLQNYAVEGKIPIYFDRGLLQSRGFEAIECGFYSRRAMSERQVIQHDPNVVARTVKTMYLTRKLVGKSVQGRKVHLGNSVTRNLHSRLVPLPSQRYKRIQAIVENIPVLVDQDDRGTDALEEAALRRLLVDIIWRHHDIPVAHVACINGIHSLRDQGWQRDQQWDNVYSFYDPADGFVKIRRDRTRNRKNLEIAILIALGQALLGDYAAKKYMETVCHDGQAIGRVFHLHLKDAGERSCHLSGDELRQFLRLARMVEQSTLHFTRVINGTEGFTPPGVLMGLMYAWYLDNRFASHIEYKMSILKVRQTQLIPEQKKTRERREQLIGFFRKTVFGNEYN